MRVLKPADVTELTACICLAIGLLAGGCLALNRADPAASAASVKAGLDVACRQCAGVKSKACADLAKPCAAVAGTCRP